MVFERLVPGEVNRARETLDGVAGKSVNVAKVLRALGGRPSAVGLVGPPRGILLQQVLEARGIDCDFVPVAAETRQCVTLIDEATGVVTELVEESRAVELEAYERLIRLVQRRLAGCRAAIMSGTIASGGPPDLYARCVRLAREARALAVVDAAGLALAEALKARPDLVKPNRAELAVTVGRSLPDEAGVWSAIREVGERGAGQVVVTAGARSTLAWDGKQGWRLTPPSIKVVNPIGSGDAFTAGLVLRLARGDDLGEACRWGAAAGAANALSLLAGEVEPREVERLAERVTVERLTL
jgi:tagatose 6-phosphate kinase